MMTQAPRELEDQIRRGLHDRASGVTPSPMTAADLLDRRPIEPDDQDVPQLTQPLTGDPFQPSEHRQWPRTPILVGLVGLVCFVAIGLFSSNLAQRDRSPLTTVNQAADGQPDDLPIITTTTSSSSAAVTPTSPPDQASADPGTVATAPTDTAPVDAAPADESETTTPTAAPAHAPPVAMSVGSPVADQVVANGLPFEFHGTATSEQASIVIVRVVIQDLDTRLYLQPDGSFSKLWNATDAELDDPGEQVGVRAWRHTQEAIPAGRYQVRLRAIDSANDRTDWLLTPFTVAP